MADKLNWLLGQAWIHAESGLVLPPVQPKINVTVNNAAPQNAYDTNTMREFVQQQFAGGAKSVEFKINNPARN